MSKPETDAGKDAGDRRVLAAQAGEVGTVASAPGLLDADIGGEFAADFVAQPRADLDLIEPCADAELANVLRRQIGLDPWLEDQALRNALVDLGLDRCDRNSAVSISNM